MKLRRVFLEWPATAWNWFWTVYGIVLAVFIVLIVILTVIALVLDQAFGIRWGW